MTFEEITALTFESTYPTLINRVLDLSVVPSGEAPYSLHKNEELGLYERILFHPTLVKPSMEVFNAELADYKSELEAAEQARLDEIARVEDITNRFRALGNLRRAMEKADKNVPNPELLLKEIIETDDTQTLSALESYNIEAESEKAEKKAKEQLKATARGLLSLINGLIEIVIENNLANGLTSAQKDQQKVDNAALFQHLQDYRPAKFKQAVDAVVPDGVLVTQDMKDELLAFLAVNGIV